MNRFTRLTALLLALMMIFSTFAAAETSYQVGDMTTEKWNSLVENVEAIVSKPVIDEGDAGTVVRPAIPDQPTMGAVPGGNQYLVTTQADLTDGSVKDAVLYTSGKLIITGTQADQWQINIRGVWVDITGENGQTITVTNAMVEGIGTAVQVRQTGSPDKVAYITVMEYAATMMLVAAARASEVTEEEETAPDRANDVMTVEAANQYTVIINYSYADGTMAANPWTASLAKGSSFSATVTHPTVIGYDPTFKDIVSPEMSGVTYSATDVSIDIQAIENNVVVYITYVPGTVNYTVIHYQQNVNDDNYTIKESTTSTGTTGTKVPDKDVARKYDGFYNLLYDQPTIAADGSTIVEVYYDRYYYLMNFDLGGGYGVEPIYARYGTPIKADEIGTPVKAGYVFKGWATTQEKANAGTVDVTELPATMPAEHTTYYAVWEMNPATTVTIVYWGENADDEEYSYLSSEVATVESNKSFTYTTGLVCPLEENHVHDADCNLLCSEEAHTHDAGCYTLICDVIQTHTHTEQCYGSCTHTTHTTACYTLSNGGSLQRSNEPNSDWGTLTEVGNGVWTIRTRWGDTYYYVRIGNNWYSTGWESGVTVTYKCTHSHSDGCLSCTETVHTHTDYSGECYELTCTKAVHIHGEDCYNCGHVQHTHDDTCTVTGPGLSTNLWTYVRSDTETVNPDGSTVINVYYDRTTFTLTFKDGNTTVYTLKEKWGHNITDHWPIKGTNDKTYDDGQRWQPSGSNTYDEVLVFLEIMPAESFTLTVDVQNYDTFIMHYMVEVLPGTTGTAYNGKSFKEEFKVTAIYNYVTKAEDFFDLNGFTQWASNPAFGSNGRLDIDGGGDVYFYYTRNSYNLVFNNGEEDKRTESIKYEAPLGGYADYKLTSADAPSKYEPGSVEFGGWYLNPECSDDAKVEFSDELTMPATNVIVYAKWTPKVYTVNFYLTEADKTTGNIYAPTDSEYPKASFTVNHGETIVKRYVDAHLEQKAMLDANPRDPYKFVVWYYYDETGTKQVFTPTLQIKQNLDLFAEWTSDVLVPYTIKYAVPKTDADGNYVTDADGNWVVDYEVAAPTTGSKLAGQQETFEAKGGDELYAAYQEGYFPTLDSHTINFTQEQFEAGGVEYIFWYTSAEAVPYKVYYKIVDEDGNILGPAIKNDDGTEYIKEVNDNKKAVVTENFVVVAGFMPDAYQKRLVVSTTGENVITFYYTKDELHAYYQVTHYIKNLDGDYVEYLPPSQIPGDIGKTVYEDDALTIDGFTHVKTEYVYDNGVDEPTTTVGSPNGEHVLDAYGLQINLYYDRESYPYVVNYYKQGTQDKLATSKNGTALFGDTVTENAIDIPGYVKVDPTTQELPIRIEKADTPEYNIINFYYTEIPATINYIPVTSDGTTVTVSNNGGTVAPGSETIGAVTGSVLGSTPTAKPNYTFVGWYTDASCTDEVSSNWIDANGKITPQKTKDYDDGEADKMGYESKTYYALFELDVADLTISKVVAGVAPDDLPADTSFTFTVTDADGNNQTVTVPANESVTISNLQVGDYTITEGTSATIPDYVFKQVKVNDVVASSTSVTLVKDQSVTVTFTNVYELDVADLTITKTVNGAPAGIAEQEFAITVSLPEKAGGYTYIKTLADKSTQQGALTTNGGTLYIKNGETIVIKDVAIGSQYSVTETEPSYFTVTDEVENEEIRKGENEVNLINTYKSGQMSITKTVQAAENVDVSSAEFTFKVSLTPAVTGDFSYTVNDLTQTATFDNKGIGTITLKAGETAAFTTLPHGVQYTVEENTAQGFVLDTDAKKTYGLSGTIDTANASSSVFTNIHQYGNLVISKTVSGADAPGGKFVFNITLNNGAFTKTYNGVEFKEGKAQVELSVAKNETKTAAIIGLPAGTTYTVTEEAVPGYTTTITDAAGTIDAAGTDTVAFVNEYKTGTLTIKKVVTAAKDVTAPEKDFDFIVTLKDTSGNALTGSYAYTIDNGDTSVSLSSGDTITLKHDQTATFGKLPDGVTFEVVETADSDYVTTATPNGSAVDGGYKVSGAISADNAQAVEFTNFYNYGNLTITKNVEGAPADLTEQEEFNVQISGLTDGTYSVARSAQSATETLTVSGGKGTLTIKHGETLVIKNIKDGTKVTVTEIEVPSYFEATPASSSMTIDADATDSSANTVAITNTYKPGSLTITKTVQAAPGVTVPADDFVFTVMLPGMTNKSFAANVTGLADATTLTFNAGVATFKMKAGGSVKISNLPAGVAYTVAEATNANYTTTVAVTGDAKATTGQSATGTTASGEVQITGATIAFTNTYQYSDLKISKTVVNNTDFTPAVNAFVFTVQLSGASVPTQVTYIIGGASYTATVDAGQFKLTLTNSQTATIKNLPAGTTYTVTEAEVSGYTTTITKNSATITEATGTIVAGAQTVDEVVFTNEYKVGSLEVTKEVVGGDAPKGEKFTFTLTLSDTATTVKCAIGDGTATDFQSGNTFELEKGQKALITGIPAGVEYTVTETENPDYTTKVGETETNTATGTIVAGSSSQVEFTNTYKYSHLTITKTGMKDDESAIFTVRAVTKEHPEGTTYTIALSNGEVTLTGLLIGSQYSVDEDEGWSNRYASTTVTSGAASGMIVEGGKSVTYNNSQKNEQWLHDEFSVHNDFSKDGKYQ